MTGLIAIDESGDLGPNGSRFFLIAAIITSRSRHLLSVYKSVPTSDGPEIKFYDATHDERLNALKKIALADVTIVYACVDKEKFDYRHHHNNDLYRQVLNDVITVAMKISKSKDVNIIVDGSSFIKNNELRNMAEHISKDIGKNIKRCNKTTSDRCVRIADYVAGSVLMRYERGSSEYFKIIHEKISVARES